jgi:nuclear protein localization protein 4 homolog
MLLRVRSKVGTWRVEGLSPQTTVGELKARVLAEHHVTPHESQAFSLDPAGQRTMPEGATLEALGLRHGDLIHLSIREEDCAVEAGKKIAADGTIINKSHHEVANSQGFRPGMRSLRSMKMHWTLTDFVELDSQVRGGVGCGSGRGRGGGSTTAPLSTTWVDACAAVETCTRV